MGYDSHMAEKGKIAVVTGGAGFIGAHLVEGLVARGYHVRVIDNLVAGKKEHVHPDAEFHQVDILDIEQLRPIMKGATYVFHLAALPRVQYSIEHPQETNKVNVEGTLNVLDVAREAGITRVVYSASSSAYGDQPTLPLHEDLPALPQSPYGIQKYVGEHYARFYSEIQGLPTVSLRYFNVYGPRMNLDGAYALVMGVFLKQKLAGKPLLITGDGKQTRDFTHVRDVVRANILAGEHPNLGHGEVINIGSGKNYSINALAQMMGGQIEYIPARKEPKNTLADNRKAKKLMGWEPTVSLEDGIQEILKEWGLA